MVIEPGSSVSLGISNRKTQTKIVHLSVSAIALTLIATCGGGGSPAPASGGESQVTVLSNPSGPCLVISGARGRVIENQVIGPCGGSGIEILDGQDVTIRNVTINGATGSGIHVFGSSRVSISESLVMNSASGMTAVESSSVQVSCNRFENPRGPMPRGQFVQFDKVTGGGNTISCNSGVNEPGRGNPEDAISIYKSQGLPGQPISVLNNLIVGGGPSESGGGIMLGDGGGAHQVAQGNVLVDPGQYGVAIASGQAMSIVGNRIYARSQPFTNVGIYVWNQSSTACSDISVRDNQVSWRSKTGQSNPYWNAGNCGPVAGDSQNTFQASLSEALAASRPPPECICQTHGWR